ncbi:MAG: DUF1326 domain-containing protein [Acidobacteria bacterium]|nr:DUF1326 domain-containing protein [Acidobacteriota bacterium]
MTWRVAGAYLESCNCDAICPCRMVDGVAGGRSTYGTCFGLLGWRIDVGAADGLDVAGLGVALAVRYDDDEPGSPWQIVLYVDAQGNAAQQEALADIFLGRRGGPNILKLPWVRKPSDLVAVRPAHIELGDDGRNLRIGDVGSIAVSRRADAGSAVACGIPGYDRGGIEYYADELEVADDPFRWRLEGNCAFATDFDYASA